MSISNNLRQLRLNSGMTQEQVAEKIGLTRQALSSYESGRTRPDIDMLVRLSEVYETDIDGIVYGQDRALKSLRIIKRVSLFLHAIITLLTVMSSAFLWSANRFYAIQPGLVLAGEEIVLQSRFRLTSAWKTVDGLLLTLAFVGFLSLLILCAVWKCRIATKTKLLYLVSLAASVLAIPALFGIFDAAYGIINYLFTPIYIVAEMLVLFWVHLVIAYIQKHRGNRREWQGCRDCETAD